VVLEKKAFKGKVYRRTVADTYSSGELKNIYLSRSTRPLSTYLDKYFIWALWQDIYMF